MTKILYIFWFFFFSSIFSCSIFYLISFQAHKAKNFIIENINFSIKRLHTCKKTFCSQHILVVTLISFFSIFLFISPFLISIFSLFLPHLAPWTRLLRSLCSWNLSSMLDTKSDMHTPLPNRELWRLNCIFSLHAKLSNISESFSWIPQVQMMLLRRIEHSQLK